MTIGTPSGQPQGFAAKIALAANSMNLTRDGAGSGGFKLPTMPKANLGDLNAALNEVADFYRRLELWAPPAAEFYRDYNLVDPLSQYSMKKEFDGLKDEVRSICSFGVPEVRSSSMLIWMIALLKVEVQDPKFWIDEMIDCATELAIITWKNNPGVKEHTLFVGGHWVISPEYLKNPKLEEFLRLFRALKAKVDAASKREVIFVREEIKNMVAQGSQITFEDFLSGSQGMISLRFPAYNVGNAWRSNGEVLIQSNNRGVGILYVASRDQILYKDVIAGAQYVPLSSIPKRVDSNLNQQPQFAGGFVPRDVHRKMLMVWRLISEAVQYRLKIEQEAKESEAIKAELLKGVDSPNTLTPEEFFVVRAPGVFFFRYSNFNPTDNVFRWRENKVGDQLECNNPTALIRRTIDGQIQNIACPQGHERFWMPIAEPATSSFKELGFPVGQVLQVGFAHTMKAHQQQHTASGQ